MAYQIITHQLEIIFIVIDEINKIKIYGTTSKNISKDDMPYWKILDEGNIQIKSPFIKKKIEKIIKPYKESKNTLISFLNIVYINLVLSYWKFCLMKYYYAYFLNLWD